MADAEAAAHAGACAVVLECVPQEVAATITQSIAVPTIGIGAGLHCDGQVLVGHDLLGLFDGHRPKFVRPYANLKDVVQESIKRYSADVRARAFPSSEESFR
jgi:3-methyl-2-oxobutanoate hydroxymethyltransferase